MNKPRYETSCVERFLRYITVDTQSQPASQTYPSSEGQIVLQKILAKELRDLGVSDVVLDGNGYLFATLPENTTKPSVPVIGLLAHVDTTPDVIGKNVTPLVHPNYRGQDIVLPDAPDTVIRVNDNPDLRNQIGNTIITASGTTLLGADDKAGIAEIFGAMEYLIAHPEIPHGEIRIGVTPDQELAKGTLHFDIEKFGAHCAYTIDGQGLGQLQTESFSADTLHVEFGGVTAHPGYAKGRMINAAKLAAQFVHQLPADSMSPESTEGYQGYAHPYAVDASTDRARVSLLIRDFNEAGLRTIEAQVEALAKTVVAQHPGATLKTRLEPSYRNMHEILRDEPLVVERARAAIGRAGLDVRSEPLRGGTDGSQLCFMGLPTPNLFAGQHNFHSPVEWISTYDMEKAVEVIIELCREWEERSPVGPPSAGSGAAPDQVV